MLRATTSQLTWQTLSFFFLLCPSPLLAAENVRAAAERGLRLLEQGAGRYVHHRECFSCHHQAVAMLAFPLARSKGLSMDEARLKEQIQFTIASFAPRAERIRKGQGIPGGNTMAAYALFSLEVAGHPADETTTLLIDYLLLRQREDGSWPAVTPRPPSEGSTFTNNALALRALRHYGSNLDSERKRAIARARKRGLAWLQNHTPADMEDASFLLRGLIEGGSARKEIDLVRDSLLDAQNDDGSWSQLPELAGDAYATASVLLALRQAGVSPSHEAYQKGVTFLLRSQKRDGSWYVATRSRPVQTFFDNGDPHGKHQFISFMATGWAVSALLESLPDR